MPLFRIMAELWFTIDCDSIDKARAEAVRALGAAEVEIEASESNETLVEVQCSDIVCLIEEPNA